MRNVSFWTSGVLLSLLLVLSGCGSGGNSGTNTSVVLENGNFNASIDGRTYRLEYRIYRPNDSLTHPLVIMTHGRNGPQPSINPNEIQGYSVMNTALANRGYAVMMLVRRGYGNSDGPDNELKDTPYESGLEAAKDLQSAVEFMKNQPYVNPNKIIVMGHSQGGWAAIAFSTLTVHGVLGTVNLSGGVNYTTIQTDPISTVYSKWAADCGEYGKIAKIPSLWIYAPNDLSIPAIASQSMYNSFRNENTLATFIMKPAYGSNGHLYCDEPSFFMDDLIQFFNNIGFTN